MILTDTKSSPARARIPLTQPPKNRVRREVWRILWFALGTQLLVALTTFSPRDPSWTTWSSTAQFQNWLGRTGSIEADILFQLFGLAAFALVALCWVVALRHPMGSRKKEDPLPWYLPLTFILALCALVQATVPATWSPLAVKETGGLLGGALQNALEFGVGGEGAIWMSALALICTAILLLNLPLLSWCWRLLVHAGSWTRAQFATAREGVRNWRQKRVEAAPLGVRLLPEKCPPKDPPVLDHSLRPTPPPEAAPLLDLISFTAPKRTKPTAVKRPRFDPNAEFDLPPASLLPNGDKREAPLDREWFVEKSRILVEKLNDFGVEGEIVNISPGPVITVYEFKPASGVKIKEIANLTDDLTLALSVLSVRIVAPIPGKPVVGIEIPSPKREKVLFRELMEETPFYESKVKIPILLGRLASGEPVLADLSSMPHMLVAGATGTGKSVFINSLITSLLFRFTPNDLKLIMVDPKMVELSHYEGIPHLLLPVVVDSKKASQALRWTVAEMERRYSLLHRAGVRHLDSYNEKIREMTDEERAELPDDERDPLPYIVVIIDEYADLMAVVPKEVEHSITRLAQKARASGIHLVLATQRPSTDVVTGLIKANFPSRLSFRVASAVDSKTILDRTGAERLLGNGDLLLHSAGFATLKRMQGAFIADKETERVVDFLKDQGEPNYDESILAEVENAGGDGESEEHGELYDQAVRLVTEKGEASISLIQRSLRIGYNRAANLMDALEKEGVVAPASGNSKRRQVLVNSI